MRRASLMMKCMLLSLKVQGRSQLHHLLNQNVEYIVQVVPGPVYWSSLIAGIEHWQPPAIFGNWPARNFRPFLHTSLLERGISIAGSA
jgi:hypothetical protein